MTPVGHAAFAYLAAAPRTAGVRAPIWVVVGSMLPDVLDKSLLLLRVFPWSRTIGHSAAVWAAALCVVYLWDLEARPVPRARWLCWGALSHLVCDLVDDFGAGFESTGYAFTAWFGFPWTNPDMAAWSVGAAFPPTRAVSTLELGCYALCAAYLWWQRQQDSILIRP